MQAASTKQTNIKTYRKQRIRMLEREFMVKLTAEEKEYFDTLNTEIAIDRYFKHILKERWD